MKHKKIGCIFYCTMIIIMKESDKQLKLTDMITRSEVRLKKVIKKTVTKSPPQSVATASEIEFETFFMANVLRQTIVWPRPRSSAALRQDSPQM